jgi:hypothetical protein
VIGVGKVCRASAFAEPLSGNAERTVEAVRRILEGNERRQLDDGVIVEVASQALDDTTRDPIVRSGHRLGIAENRLLACVKETTLAPTAEGPNLLRADTSLQQGRRIEIDSEGGIVDLRNAHGHELAQGRVDWRRAPVDHAIKGGDGHEQPRRPCPQEGCLQNVAVRRRWFQKNGRR